MPLPKDYEPPAAPSQKDLGPPPPGYGRYAEFDRISGAQSAQPNYAVQTGFTGGVRRNLDDVLCFKVRVFPTFFLKISAIDVFIIRV